MYKNSMTMASAIKSHNSICIEDFETSERFIVWLGWKSKWLWFDIKMLLLPRFSVEVPIPWRFFPALFCAANEIWSGFLISCSGTKYPLSAKNIYRLVLCTLSYDVCHSNFNHARIDKHNDINCNFQRFTIWQNSLYKSYGWDVKVIHRYPNAFE